MTINISMDEIPSSSLEKIHERSITILADTGVVFHSEAALDLFKRRGATVDGKTVYIPEKLVDKALESCPSRFEWTARDPNRSVVVGKRFLVQPPVGAVYIRDMDSGRRPALLEDFANIAGIELALIDQLGLDRHLDARRMADLGRPVEAEHQQR